MTPTMSLLDDGAIVVDIGIDSEMSDGDAGVAAQIFWDSVVQQFAFSITEHLRIAIQDQLAL